VGGHGDGGGDDHAARCHGDGDEVHIDSGGVGHLLPQGRGVRVVADDTGCRQGEREHGGSPRPFGTRFLHHLVPANLTAAVIVLRGILHSHRRLRAVAGDAAVEVVLAALVEHRVGVQLAVGLADRANRGGVALSEGGRSGTVGRQLILARVKLHQADPAPRKAIVVAGRARAVVMALGALVEEILDGAALVAGGATRPADVDGPLGALGAGLGGARGLQAHVAGS